MYSPFKRHRSVNSFWIHVSFAHTHTHIRTYMYMYIHTDRHTHISLHKTHMYGSFKRHRSVNSFRVHVSFAHRWQELCKAKNRIFSMYLCGRIWIFCIVNLLELCQSRTQMAGALHKQSIVSSVCIYVREYASFGIMSVSHTDGRSSAKQSIVSLVCIHVREYASLYTCTHTISDISSRLELPLCMYVCMYACIHIHKSTNALYVYIHERTYTLTISDISSCFELPRQAHGVPSLGPSGFDLKISYVCMYVCMYACMS
jgi:hypothetical protein